MRLRPDTGYCIGLWFCAYENDACLALLTRPETMGSETRPVPFAMHLGILSEHRPVVQLASPRTGITQRAFWEICHDRVCQSVDEFEQSENLGALLCPFRYVVIESSLEAAMLICKKLDPYSNPSSPYYKKRKRQWFAVEDMVRFFDDRNLMERTECIELPEQHPENAHTEQGT